MQKNKNVQSDEQETINVYEIWLIIKKRWWLICAITLLFFAFSVYYSVRLPDVYKVSNVMQKPYSVGINMADIKANVLLLKDLTGEQQARRLGLEKSVIEEIRSINITKIEGTESFKLQVDTTDPSSGVKMITALVAYADELPFVQKQVARTKKILKEDRDVLKKIIDNPSSLLNLPDKTIIYELLPSLYDLKTKYNAMNRTIRELEEGGVINLASKTFIPEAPYKPKRVRLTIGGLFAGIFIGIFCVVFVEWLGNARRQYRAQ